VTAVSSRRNASASAAERASANADEVIRKKPASRQQTTKKAVNVIEKKMIAFHLWCGLWKPTKKKQMNCVRKKMQNGEK
jgi:hypothetical protein